MANLLRGDAGSIGERVKNRRIKIGISQRELAKNAGVSYRTVIRLEKGGKIREKMLEKILEALKTLELSGKEPGDWWKWHRKGAF
jgi:transcriptional regulator with XRE-family HTH domain